MGATWVVFQIFGSSPVDTDCLKMSVNRGANSSASSLRKREGMVSGPPALVGFMFSKSFFTPDLLI